MPLVPLQTVPDFRDRPTLLSWSFNHWTQHQEIFGGISATYSVTLNQYQIDPIPLDDLGTWLANHQQMHDDFNAILNYPGADLQNIDFNDQSAREFWAFLHWNEHQNANSVLNLS